MSLIGMIQYYVISSRVVMQCAGALIDRGSFLTHKHAMLYD